jgi:hypothetical protein
VVSTVEFNVKGHFRMLPFEFAEQGLTAKIHGVLVSEMNADKLIGHFSRESRLLKVVKRRQGRLKRLAPKWLRP